MLTCWYFVFMQGTWACQGRSITPFVSATATYLGVLAQQLFSPALNDVCLDVFAWTLGPAISALPNVITTCHRELLSDDPITGKHTVKKPKAVSLVQVEYYDYGSS